MGLPAAMSICIIATLRGPTLASVRRPRPHRAIVVSSAHALVSAGPWTRPSFACLCQHALLQYGADMCCRSPPLHTSWSQSSAEHSWYISILGGAACDCGWGSCSRGPGFLRGISGDAASFRVRPARARSSATHFALCCPNQFVSISNAAYLSRHGSST